MPARSQRNAGFSLVELMIVVAIVGILASIAVPGFQRMQLRSKSAEGRSNLASIRTAQESYFVEFGTYITAVPTPATPPTEALSWPGEAGFDQIGWDPDEAIRFQYAVTTNALPGARATAYTAEAVSDMDLDGTLNIWGYVHQTNLGVGVAGTLGCLASGVWDTFTSTATLTSTVGPCNAASASGEY